MLVNLKKKNPIICIQCKNKKIFLTILLINNEISFNFFFINSIIKKLKKHNIIIKLFNKIRYLLFFYITKIEILKLKKLMMQQKV